MIKETWGTPVSSMAIFFEMFYHSFKGIFLRTVTKMTVGFLHAKVMSDCCLVNLCQKKKRSDQHFISRHTISTLSTPMVWRIKELIIKQKLNWSLTNFYTNWEKKMVNSYVDGFKSWKVIGNNKNNTITFI